MQVWVGRTEDKPNLLQYMHKMTALRNLPPNWQPPYTSKNICGEPFPKIKAERHKRERAGRETRVNFCGLYLASFKIRNISNAQKDVQ